MTLSRSNCLRRASSLAVRFGPSISDLSAVERLARSSSSHSRLLASGYMMAVANEKKDEMVTSTASATHVGEEMLDRQRTY
jgi:hypothetical protein